MTEARYGVVQKIGLIAGPVAALVTYLLLPGSFESQAGDVVAFTSAGRATLAAMVWMGTWWLTEAINISATALLPVALFPIAGIADIASTTAPYANHIVFLFMGGFLLALSMQRWGLDRRIALLTLRFVGTKPANMVGGIMVATAVLSAFVSNTATAAMMLPIAMSVVVLVHGRRAADGESNPAEGNGGPVESNLAICLMLGIAYAASIGGIATIIGTPPNAFLVSYISDKIDTAYRTNIGFAQWMLLGVPFAAVFLPITWLVLTRVVFPIREKEVEGGRAMIEAEYRKLGRMSRGEWATFIVFLMAAIAWIIRPVLADGIAAAGEPGTDEAQRVIPPLIPGLSDAGIAMCAGLVLFLIPSGRAKGEFVMNWPTARRLPWGILILFGGGLSLAAAVEANGVADFIGAQAGLFAAWPTIVFILIIVAGMVFLSELTSNTAQTAALIPVLAPLAIGLDMHPFMLIVPATLAASAAFMMPVGTPPNAIVFGSGYVTIPQMCKAGVILNLIGIVLITALAYTIMMTVLT